MKHYNRVQTEILQALACFQYLTSSQFASLGIVQSKRSIYKPLKVLSDGNSPEIGKINYTMRAKQGKLESIFYLRKRGVKVLLESGQDENTIKYPKRDSVSFASDYFHRVWTVDFFIKAKAWAVESDYDFENFSYYFQQSKGSNRNNLGGSSLSDNRIDISEESYIIPDGVGLVDRDTERPIFFLFEQHNGRDTKRFLKQVNGHLFVIREGLASIKYNIKHNDSYVANRVFCVFEHEGCMKASQHRLAQSEDFSPFMNFFHFKTTKNLQNTSFSEGWELASGTQVQF